jgi:hypothetical protein
MTADSSADAMPAQRRSQNHSKTAKRKKVKEKADDDAERSGFPQSDDCRRTDTSKLVTQTWIFDAP